LANNFNNIRRILVLGHTGFIGSCLERHFRHLLPDIEIVGRSLPNVDLTKEEDVINLSDFFNLESAVIMCAAIKRQFGDSLDTFLQNLSMTMNLCRLLEKRPVKRFIFFSSAAVYGEDIHNINITEQTPVHPTSYYGMAKHISECLFTKVIGQEAQGSLVILRPPLIYGPGDAGETYGPVKFINAARDKEQITLWGDGRERREFIFIEDIIKIVYHLVFHKYTGVINVASGKSHSFRDVIEIVSHLISDDLKLNSRPRTKEKVDNEFSNSRFINLFKDFSFVGLDEGIGRTFDAENKSHISIKNKQTGK